VKELPVPLSETFLLTEYCAD